MIHTLTLAAIYLLPQVVIPGAAAKSSASLAIVGLALMVITARRWYEPTPLLWLYIGFALVLFFVSAWSGQLISVAYAGQYLVYVLVLAFLAPPGGADRALLVIGAVFAVEVLASLWTGPLGPDAGASYRVLGEVEVLRALGVTSSPNLAGGIAAMFAIHAWAHGRPTLVLLSVAALIATRSVSAMLAFTAAAMLLAALPLLRPRFRLSRAMAAIVVVIGAGGALWFGSEDLWAADPGERVGQWLDGLGQWAGRDPAVAAIGGGMASFLVGDKFYRPHNAYLEILGDGGVIGMALAILVLGSTACVLLVRATRCRLTPGETFGLGAVVVLALHSMSQQYVYALAMVPFVVMAARAAGARAIRRGGH